MESSLSRSPFPLRGRTYLVTGVSRRIGIGAAIARQIAAWGGSLVISHYKPHDEAQPWGADDLSLLKASIIEHLIDGATLTDHSVNFLEDDTPDQLMKAIETKGIQLDGIICNHALSGSDGSLGELDAAMLDRHYQVNTRSTILLAQAYVRLFGGRGQGRIVMMTSGQGMGPMPGEVAYSLAKAAIAGITLTLSDQLADQNITVNTVNPGPVDTGYLTEEAWQNVRNKFPMGRFGAPEDPARLIAWLLTDEACWITGQTIHSEGGFARWR